MEAQLRLDNFVFKVDVAEVEYTAPLGNGMRVFCGRVARRQNAPVTIADGATGELTLGGHARRVWFVRADDTGHYFIGVTE